MYVNLAMYLGLAFGVVAALHGPDYDPVFRALGKQYPGSCQ